MTAERRVIGKRAFANALVMSACLLAVSSAAKAADDTSAAKISVDPPDAQLLSLGTAVIHFRTNNLRVQPAFGSAALSITPRVGHVHVNVDDAPWVWAHTSVEPVTITGLAPGPHKIRLQLMTANHQRLDEAAVNFHVPKGATGTAPASHSPQREHVSTAKPATDQPPAKIIIDTPAPEPLARGVVFVRYRTENLDVVPVFGAAAVAVSPRIGHVHITVDDAPWHWEDVSRNPVIVQGLTGGNHKILIELADANHAVIAQGTVDLTAPSNRKNQPGKQ